jgi:hypothetical protein
MIQDLEFFLAHDFQDMDGEPGDFTVAEGHGYPLVFQKEGHSKGDMTIVQRKAI